MAKPETESRFDGYSLTLISEAFALGLEAANAVGRPLDIHTHDDVETLDDLLTGWQADAAGGIDAESVRADAIAIVLARLR